MPAQYEFLVRKKLHIELFIEDTVSLFRRALAAHVKPHPNARYLPQELHAPAIHLIIEALAAYITNFPLSGVQQQKIKRSHSLLNQIIDRKLSYSDESSTVERQSSIQVVHPGVNHAHKHKLHKL